MVETRQLTVTRQCCWLWKFKSSQALRRPVNTPRSISSDVSASWSPRWPANVTQWFPRQPQLSVPRRHHVVVRTSVIFFGLVCLNYFNVEQRQVLKISSLWTFTVLVHSWKLIHQYLYSYQYFLAFVVLSETLKSTLGKISRFINRSLVVANVIISVDLFLMTWREVSNLHDTWWGFFKGKLLIWMHF